MAFSFVIFSLILTMEIYSFFLIFMISKNVTSILGGYRFFPRRFRVVVYDFFPSIHGGIGFSPEFRRVYVFSSVKM